MTPRARVVRGLCEQALPVPVSPRISAGAAAVPAPRGAGAAAPARGAPRWPDSPRGGPRRSASKVIALYRTLHRMSQGSKRGRFRPVRWPLAATEVCNQLICRLCPSGLRVACDPGDGHESGGARAPRRGTARDKRHPPAEGARGSLALTKPTVVVAAPLRRSDAYSFRRSTRKEVVPLR
jgi:hypothetical protein